MLSDMISIDFQALLF